MINNKDTIYDKIDDIVSKISIKSVADEINKNEDKIIVSELEVGSNAVKIVNEIEARLKTYKNLSDIDIQEIFRTIANEFAGKVIDGDFLDSNEGIYFITKGTNIIFLPHEYIGIKLGVSGIIKKINGIIQEIFSRAQVVQRKPKETTPVVIQKIYKSLMEEIKRNISNIDLSGIESITITIDNKYKETLVGGQWIEEKGITSPRSVVKTMKISIDNYKRNIRLHPNNRLQLEKASIEKLINIYNDNNITKIGVSIDDEENIVILTFPSQAALREALYPLAFSTPQQKVEPFEKGLNQAFIREGMTEVSISDLIIE